MKLLFLMSIVESKLKKMVSPKFLLTLSIVAVFCTNFLLAQAPNWIQENEIEHYQYGNTMNAVMFLSDECTPAGDANDLIGAFDLEGNIRGAIQTNFDIVGTPEIETLGWFTIYSDGTEDIFFKVYDASNDQIFSIYNFSISFTAEGKVGIPTPLELIFDSNSSATGNAGPDQEIFNSTSTNLAATGTGFWAIVEGSGGSIVNNTNPTTAFSGDIDKTYVLSWTQDNAGACIGESDEVNITFVLNEPEDILRTCTDGLDNDGDGLYDCDDPECDRPTITGLDITDPSSSSCILSDQNGSLTINHTNGDMFSKDNGLTFQTSNAFPNLFSGEYNMVVENTNTTCQLSAIAKLNNPDKLDIIAPDILLNCSDKYDTELHANVSDGVPPFTTIWKDAADNVIPNGQKVQEGKFYIEAMDINNCSNNDSLEVTRAPDPLLSLPTDFINGPTLLCRRMYDVLFYVDLEEDATTDIVWSYSGGSTVVTEQADDRYARFDFYSASNPANVEVTLMNKCSQISDDLAIDMASNSVCTNNFNYCHLDVTVTSGELDIPGIQVHRAQNTLTIDPNIANKDFQFSAGQSIEFKAGFEVLPGNEILAEIKSCSN